VNIAKRFSNTSLTLMVALVLTALIPLALHTNQYAMVLITTVLMYAILASAWNIIGGMGGQFDLGAFGYVGLGAFTTGTLLIRWNITPWIGMIASGFVAALIAMVIGFPLFGFKVRELWYALSSAAMVEVLRVATLMWDQVGGPTERYLPSATLPPILSLRFNTYLPYYYIMFAILAVVIFLNIRIRYSKLGYSLLALGEDEDAVEVLGVNSRTAKLKALFIYAFICGVVGGLYACIYGVIHNSYFSTSMSVEVAILGIVGGVGITYGPALAAVVMVSIREALRANLSGDLQAVYLMIYAVILILIALYQPRGMAALLESGVKKIRTYFVEHRYGHPENVKSQ
jgi:branched-chain amino acid transport system permease protein